MNDLQVRLSRILELGLAEHASLASQPEPPLDVLDDLADTMEKLPRLIYDWRRVSVPTVDGWLRTHQERHPGCPFRYRRLLDETRVPDWQFWNHRRVRESALRGDDRLNPAQTYMLAVELGLFKATHTAAWGQERDRIRMLGELAARIPDLAALCSLDVVEALAGPTGPWADAGCPLWMVFQPLTAPLDAVVMKYLR